MMEFEYYPSVYWRGRLPTKEVNYQVGGTARDPIDLVILYHENEAEFYRQLKWAAQTGDWAHIKLAIKIIGENDICPPYDSIMKWAWDNNQPKTFIRCLYKYLSEECDDLSGIDINYIGTLESLKPDWSWMQLNVLRALPHSDRK